MAKKNQPGNDSTQSNTSQTSGPNPLHGLNPDSPRSGSGPINTATGEVWIAGKRKS